jgi:flagellar motility protein MotE (MotC chaperone)
MLAVLTRKEKELKEREEELARNEERLNIVKADIDARLSELKSEHEKIAALVKKIDEINDQRVKKIVKIYESMSPEEAASRLEKLDEEMAVMILAAMSERKAAKVLSFVDVSRSARLSQSLRVKN